MAIIVHDFLSQAILYECINKSNARDYLEKLKGHHSESYKHSFRVGILSIDIAKIFGLPREVLGLVGISGVLHDIGKLEVPAYLLDNTIPELTDEQKRIIRSHPEAGQRILGNFENGIPGEVAREHHEFKKDSSPRKVRTNSKDLVDVFCAIVALADFADTLVCPRSYQRALTVDESREALKHFNGDSRLVDIALSLMKDVRGEYVF